MIQNSKVITENEFMQKRKIILLRFVATLKDSEVMRALLRNLLKEQGEMTNLCLTDFLKNLRNYKVDTEKNPLHIAAYKK